MINSKSIPSQIQTQFHLPSNSYEKSSPSCHSSLNFHKTHLINPLRSIGTIPVLQSKAAAAAATNGFYTPSPEETLYDLLGISENGTLSDIKRAYKQMALKYHPDVSPADQADEYTMRFILIQEAYETLSDPESRAMYDSCVAKGLHQAFSGRKGSRFEARSAEKARWKQSWEVQVNELKRRRTVEATRVGRGGRISWATRMRKQRSEACAHGSGPDQ